MKHMELNLKKVQQMDSIQIYNLLLPIINRLYNSSKYINISNEDYIKLVLKEISDSKKTYTGDQNYIDYIKRKIKFQLSEITKKMLFDSKTSFTLLNNYITQKIVNISSYAEAIKYFKKLSRFLETYNYVPNPDLLIELITKNGIFNKIIVTIFNEYHVQITSGKVEELFDDSLLLSTIDTYCMLNNIEINEEENITQDYYDASELSTTDTVRMYLIEIGKRPLLSIEQERDLAIRIAEGDSKARKLFIESNLKLVVSIARKYIGRGLSFLDLIQEGNLGLMTAVDKYNVNKGYKFSTYATYWIRQVITRAIADKGRNVRIPVHMYEKVGLYKKAITKLEDKLGRSPTINEMANEMGLSISEVTKLHKLQGDTISINSFIGDEKDSELGNFIPSFEQTPEDIAIDETLKSQIRNLFEKCNLKPREIDVLMLRYGFNDRNPMTLDELGKKYHLTHERVRQIEAGAIMKIRMSEHIKEFAAYTIHPEQSLQNIEEFREKYRESKNPYYKVFLKDDCKTKERNSEEEMPRLQTIYEYFKDYTKEQVDEMLTRLTDEERALVTIRYGEDLNNPVSTKLSKEQINKFYGSLVPKMKRLLSNPTGERKARKPRQRKVKVQQSVVEQPTGIEEIITDEIIEKNSDVSQESLKGEFTTAPSASTIIQKNPEQPEQVEGELITKLAEPQEQSMESTPSNNGEMTKEDCIKILELLRTPSFAQMMSTLSVKEAVIISLKLGYMDGKYFSTESISEFLGIEPSEVIETTKKVLSVYKENINNFLDNAIAVATDEVGKDRVLSIKNYQI